MRFFAIFRRFGAGCARSFAVDGECVISSAVPAATETHSVPAVIPRHHPVTFLNCNTHSGPGSGIAT